MISVNQKYRVNDLCSFHIEQVLASVNAFLLTGRNCIEPAQIVPDLFLHIIWPIKTTPER